MLRIDTMWYEVNPNSFAPCPGKGSALVLCLVFLSALSTTALGALEAAWSGQRMISAYVSHQQAFLRFERALLDAEHKAWQQIYSSGLEQFLSFSQDTENLQTITVIKPHGEWISADFSQQQCGPLFGVSVLPANGSGSHVGLRVQWDVCCQSTESCMTSGFTQLRRVWSRQAVSSEY